MVRVVDRTPEEEARENRLEDLMELTRTHRTVFEVFRGPIGFHIGNPPAMPLSKLGHRFPLSVYMESPINQICVSDPEWLDTAVNIAEFYESQRKQYGQWEVKKKYREPKSVSAIL